VKIKKAINETAWDGDWYVRCYDDNGNPIGSHKNTQGKIFTNAQSWAMIAGISDPERTDRMIASLNKITLTDLGHMLLAPTFFVRDESVGRISCLEPGICENGTIYSHVNVWMILGLLRVGKADQAYDLFKRITPSYTSGKKDDPKLKVPPFVYANCYYGPDHRNNKFQMEFTWITGSVAWFYNVLLNEMLGAKSDFGGLRIEPCLPSDWKEISVDRHYRGTVYKILLKNPDGLQTGKVSLTLDGQPLEGNVLPDLKDGKVHQVEALLKKA
jgi:cellobiose phosphorylase